MLEPLKSMLFAVPPAGNEGKTDPTAKSKLKALLDVVPAVKLFGWTTRYSASVESESLLMTRAITRSLVDRACYSSVYLKMIFRTRSNEESGP